MKITRRDFLKLSGATTGFLLTSSVFDLVKIPEALADMGSKVGTETTSICCCCACGCGMLITTKNFGLPNAKVINVEGDPTHPTNEGGLCSKCLSARDTVNRVVPNGKLVSTYFEGALINEWDPERRNLAGEMTAANNRRAARVLWRPAGGTQWQVLDWTTALQKIALNYHLSRNVGFTEVDGMTVNRLDNVACLGGAAHDNQECYLLRKLMTGLGLYYIEHQARI